MAIKHSIADNEGSDAAGLPRHIAVIMDGNGRWARQRGMPRHLGHRAGVRAVREVVEASAQRGIRYLTLFAFSSENWRRPREEVSTLMSLFLEALQREIDELHANGVCLRFVGDRDTLSERLRERIAAAEELTRDNERLTLLVAVAFGGRWDLARAARRLAERVAAGSLAPADIDEAALAGELSLAGVPDPDLLIRTGGEQRISNFLLWNLAYAELWFCKNHWPDFDTAAFEEALAFYANRQRRYGCTGDQVGAA